MNDDQKDCVCAQMLSDRKTIETYYLHLSGDALAGDAAAIIDGIVFQTVNLIKAHIHTQTYAHKLFFFFVVVFSRIDLRKSLYAEDY
jgi:hypothetical protein